MSIDDFSFHDSRILEVRETSDQTIEFILDFCSDWQNNIFEQKILRFKDVITYHSDEIPFAGQVTILEIKNLGEITRTFGQGRNQFEVKRNKVEIHTNAGIRVIEYSTCELIISQ